MDVRVHAGLKARLAACVRGDSVPNILLWGPPGCGKRTVLEHVLSTAYGGPPPEQWVMRVECGRGKGIKFVREELKFFAQSLAVGAPFKSIVLLDACRMTFDAQSALRRCIELYSHSTRFFLVVEDRDRILGPITSRFCSFHVPRPMDNGRQVNMHSLPAAACVPPPDSTRAAHRILRGVEHVTPALAQQLYDRACSIYDIMRLIERRDIPATVKYAHLDYLETARSEVDDERVLLYAGALLYAMRPSEGLGNVEVV